MATKLRSNAAVVWSLVSILIAIGSVITCLPLIIDLVSDGYERTSQLAMYFVRIMRGGIV